MARFQEIISGLLCSLGVVLLMGSLALVPQNGLLAQDTGGGGSCSHPICDLTCSGSYPQCDSGDCRQSSNPTQCGGCHCIPVHVIRKCECSIFPPS